MVCKIIAKVLCVLPREVQQQFVSAVCACAGHFHAFALCRPVAEAANDQHYQRQQPSSQASPSTDIVPPQPNRQSALLERAIRTTERIQHTVHHLDEVPGHVRDGLQATGAMLTKQLESMRTVIAKTATRKTLDGAVALGGQTIAQVQRMATWVKDKLVPES
eukprot:TRINITY_DN7491_c1_g1_i2.p1 TRINITY_DN7491_c1_g1~~TRINITY_DN7491_c1_g1_i2.p1  ORF type:complete len:162 (+),score=44.19 TRINITY_DN7491_c1_g1_i2:359-844(+)